MTHPATSPTINIEIDIASENSFVIYFGDRHSTSISAQVSSQIAATAQHIKSSLGGCLVDLVSSYASLLVIYNSLQHDHLWVRHQLQQVLNTAIEQQQDPSKLIQLPVFYSPQYGPELPLLARNAGLSLDQIIDLHCATQYRVYAIGFAPGFAYLGEVDPRLATARLATPRLKVPAGAVAIADRQTAVYPAQSPGGWNLIGLCPTPMFNAEQQTHMPVAVGDRVQFYAIDQQQYLDLGGELHEF